MIIHTLNRNNRIDTRTKTYYNLNILIIFRSSYKYIKLRKEGYYMKKITQRFFMLGLSLLLLIGSIISISYHNETCTLVPIDSMSYAVTRDGQRTGTFTKYEYSSIYSVEELQDITTGKISILLQELGIFDFNNPPTDYVFSNSKYADWQLTQYIIDHQETTYFYISDSFLFAFQLDPNIIGENVEETLLDISKNILPEFS